MIDAGVTILYILLILAIAEILDYASKGSLKITAFYTGVISYSAVFLSIVLQNYIEDTVMRLVILVILLAFIKYVCDNLIEIGSIVSNSYETAVKRSIERRKAMKEEAKLFEEWKKTRDNSNEQCKTDNQSV